MRPTFTFDSAAELSQFLPQFLPTKQPVRLVFKNPARDLMRGGPSLFDIREALRPHGKLRLSGSHNVIYADLDPGPAEPTLVALETIVRSDAAGLERMLLSALPYVDEIVLGIDDRSDAETINVAVSFGCIIYSFGAQDLEMSSEDWALNKIDFSAARNIGRARVKAPWTLVLDSDEYLKSDVDIRALVADAPEHVGSFAAKVLIDSFVNPDPQRLARTRYRWTAASHNQLMFAEKIVPSDVTIVSDTSLRTEAEVRRRTEQRNDGIEDLVEEAGKGNLVALMHLAKHRAGAGSVEDAIRLAEDYRSRVEPHSALASERVWVAMAVAFRLYHDNDLPKAEMWAVRGLLDGPRAVAMCLLGDIAEEQGDLVRARGWYEAACAVTEKHKLDWPGVTELRFGRLAGICRALDGLTEDPPAP